MFLTSGILGGSGGVNVTLPSLVPGQFDRISFETTVQAGIRFAADGDIYFQDVSGIWQNSGYSWLLDGDPADYWLVRTIDDGDALFKDSDTLTQMNANLDYALISNFSYPYKYSVITFSISDDAGGSNLIVTDQYQWVCEKVTDL